MQGKELLAIPSLNPDAENTLNFTFLIYKVNYTPCPKDIFYFMFLHSILDLQTESLQLFIPL